MLLNININILFARLSKQRPMAKHDGIVEDQPNAEFGEHRFPDGASPPEYQTQKTPIPSGGGNVTRVGDGHSGILT
jgi:hypothetical protein